MTEPPLVEPKDRAAWRRWLQRHHERTGGVWLVIAKKGVDGLHLEEAVEEALCFGWIDSTARTLDERRYRLWLAPRKPGSVWSAINKGRVQRLTSEGRMTPAGQAKIDRAKTDGSWDALSASDALHEPDDLVAAFGRFPAAREHWDGFPAGVRKQILAWIEAAKRSQTRATRVEQTARLAAENIRANQWRPNGTR